MEQKFCKDCKYFLWKINGLWCTKVGIVEPVIGFLQHSSCDSQRKNLEGCGPGADWFEPKELRKSLFRRIFG